VIQKKVCLLGGSGVGKTSLVAQFVHSIFSDKYLTTIGVKIDKKSVDVDGTNVELVIWDVYGHDDFQKLRVSYLRGTSGYLLVADGTRADTFDTALEVQRLVTDSIGEVPFIFALNKADLAEDWRIDDVAIGELERRGWLVMKTSAKTGEHVEDAFAQLSRAMLLPAARSPRHG
jgi:small GTP-binding protein